MRLRELPLSDAARFWGDRVKTLSSYEILKVISVTGGVPKYLEEVFPELSAEENIRRLCFEPQGPLYREFDEIFSDLFSSRAHAYRRILDALADQSRSISEVQRLSGINRRMTVSNGLRELALAGFVSEEPTWNLQTAKASNLKRYRLSDSYVRFYLRVIVPHKQRVEEGGGEGVFPTDLSAWQTTMGLQFEHLVVRSAPALLRTIRVPPSEVVCMGPYFQRNNNRQRGCQVDLLIQTRQQTLYLCEIKFSTQKIGMDVAHQVSEKQARLATPQGWSNRAILVHVNGVTDDLKESGQFDHLVDFGDLLRQTPT